MPWGYNGKVLRIDLSTGESHVEEHSESWYRKYLGGRGIGAYYLLKEFKPGTDALSEDNMLIFATSVVTGIPFPGNARASAMAKSPLTGGFGESEAGGFWGPELKFAGFDAVVIVGKAPEPVYLYIHNGKVEIKDAAKLWGKFTGETEKIIQEALQAPNARVACIGPAGENGVLYSCITAGKHDVFGRLGMGAVMGSKNLKAVVVRGTNLLQAYDQDTVKKINRWFTENFNRPETCALFYDLGTAGGVNIYNEMGALPSYNFSSGTIIGGDRLSGENMQKEGLMIGKTRCYACPVACRKIARVDEPGPYNTAGEVHSPEYETIAALGSNCGVVDPRVVIKAGQLCDEYGIDTISAGVAISFAMEAASRGIISRDILGDLPLEFGYGEALLNCLELIAYRKGVGELLSRGVKRAAAQLGPEAEKLAVHGKGEELALQDPRGGKVGAAIGYAVSTHGGDHIQMEHDFQFAQKDSPFLKTFEPLGITEPVPAMSLGLDKVRLFILNQKVWGLYNMLDICIFVAAPGHTLSLHHVQDLVRASTGWDTSLYELMEAGERGIVMAKLFNAREGFTREDDVLPLRLSEPLKEGAAKGVRVDPEELKEAVNLYHEMMGWNRETGLPHKGKLLSLGLDWVELPQGGCG